MGQTLNLFLLPIITGMNNWILIGITNLASSSIPSIFFFFFLHETYEEKARRLCWLMCGLRVRLWFSMCFRLIW
jgi:hypothetical protein